MSREGLVSMLTTGRTLKQGRSMELGKLSRDYFDEVSVCEVDLHTLKDLGIEEGEPILVKSIHGSVVVRSRVNRKAKPGTVFIPCGPYANMVIGSSTDASGMPNFKGIIVELFAASNKDVLSIEELVREALGGA